MKRRVNRETKPAGGLSARTLRRVCGLNGLSVTELSARIHKSRWTIYRAVEDPARYPRAYRLITAALPRR